MFYSNIFIYSNLQIQVLYNITEKYIKMKQQSVTKFGTDFTKIQSIDGPPLDFSFKSIRSLNQLIQNLPTNAPPQNSQQKQMGKTNGFDTSSAIKSINTNKNIIPSMKIKSANEVQKQSQEPSQQKLQIIRTIQATDHNYLQKQNKKIVNKKEIVQKKTKKYISPLTTTLFLRYNKIVSIQNFIQLVQPVFPNLINNLMWIDLSHNRLTELCADLGELKNLKTLYLHVNYLSNFAELQKVKKATLLRTLTIHANPLQSYEQFRIIVHSILPTLKKIDSTLLTKRQTQRAEVLMKTLKKYPVIKNVKLPPEQSQNQQDEND